MSSQTPPIEWDDLPPPPDLDFSMPDDPFPSGFFDEAFDYLPDDDPFEPFMPPDSDAAAPTSAAPSYAAEDGWGWHDATLVAVGRVLEDVEQEQYSIGAIDLYANAHTGDLGGSYIEIETFDDIDQAAAYYHELQDDIHTRGLLPFQLVDYASERAVARAAERGELTPQWRGATDAEYAAYEEMQSLDAPNAPDLPPDDLDLEALFAEPEPVRDMADSTDSATFKALREIGIDANGFDPEADPPPFIDPDTGTAYWIGVFQPDKGDPDNAVTSILSLGRDPDTGEVEAQLAPVVPGDWDKAYGAAEYLLDEVRDGFGLQTAMNLAESMAVASGYLHDGREDGRFFTDRPPDRFTTTREVELIGLDDEPVGEPMRDITDDETAELPAISAPEPGSWDDLIAAQSDEEPAREAHYWQTHYRPVETPDGEPLGTALFVTEFPQLPPDFDDYIDENGMDDTVYPTEARTLEMAHFADEKDAAKFDAEFRGYLVPGLLDGPELAPEVAKLEGLSGEWEDMDYRGIVDFMSGNRAIVREANDWHLHNPNAEREAREQFENPQIELDL